jgi:hypothetical protein
MLLSLWGCNPHHKLRIFQVENAYMNLTAWTFQHCSTATWSVSCFSHGCMADLDIWCAAAGPVSYRDFWTTYC